MKSHTFTRYISGPMRSKPRLNRDLFNEVEKALRSQFPEHDVINPAKNFEGKDESIPTTEMLAIDFAQVSQADEIVLLPDWEESEGARREIQIATWLDKDFSRIVPSGLPDGLVSDDTGIHGIPTGKRGWELELLTDPPALSDSPRASALAEATALITGDRNSTYGPPTQDFDRTAAMATAWGFSANGQPIQGHHIAVFMILLKMSRLAWTPGKRDSWVDTAGYAGCGYECSVNEAK